MKPAQIVIGVVIALALAGGGFAAGMTVGRGSGAEANPSASPSGAAGRGGAGITGRLGQGGGAAGGSGAAGGQAMAGRIISVNDGSITIEVRQPGAQGASPTVTSQIVLVGSSTRIVKTVETDIKLSDLKANDQVTIVGSADANGNVSATAIVAGGNALQGLFGGQGGPGGAGRGASPSPSPSARP